MYNYPMKKIHKIIFILIYTLFVTAAGFAGTKTWRGGDFSKPADWDTPANWSPSGVPDENDDVIIDSTGIGNPVIENTFSLSPVPKNVKIKNLTIKDNKTLEIILKNYNVTLECTGGINVEGKIKLTHKWTGNSGLLAEIVDITGGNNSKIELQEAASGTNRYRTILITDINKAKNLSIGDQTDYFKLNNNLEISGVMTNDISPTTTFPDKGFSANGKTVTFSGSDCQINGSGPYVFENLTVQYYKKLTLTGSKIEIKSDISNYGTITSQNTSSVTITGTSSTIKGDGSTSFAELTIGSGKSLKLEQNINISRDFINNGIFIVNGQSVNFSKGPAPISASSTIQGNMVSFANITIENGKTLTINNTSLEISNSLTNNGIFNAGNKTVTLNPPANGTVTITGTGNAGNTKFHKLTLTNAGGKTLTIKNKITVVSDLDISGSDGDNLLNIKGPGEITLGTNQTAPSAPGTPPQKGYYLAVSTDIPIATGKTYTTKNSKPDGSNADLAAGKPSNWIFNSPAALIWTGAANNNNWNDKLNWAPKNPVLTTGPTNLTNVIIPLGCTNYPELGSSTYNAKHVTVESGAELNLKGTIITNKSLDNHGTVYMEGSAAQKEWLERTSRPMFYHKDGSTIVYQNVTAPNAEIWQGPYKKLEFKSGVPGTIKAASLEVKEQLTVNKSITLDTGSGNQTYDDTINAGGYDITLEGSTIKTKNVTANKIKVTGIWNSHRGTIESTTDIEADNWTSWGEITAKNIDVKNKLAFTGGRINVGGNLTAKELKTYSTGDNGGLIIFNGSGTQKLSGKDGNNIIDGKIQNLEIKSGTTLQLESDITITVGLNNQGKFDAETNSKTVKLFHTANLPPQTPPAPTPTNTITIKGKTNKDDTKFHNLICTTTTGGKFLKIDGEISVTGDLTLSGVNGDTPLTIYSSNDAKIHLNANHDLDSSNNAKGNFLKIYTDSVKIQPRGKYYVVKDSKDDDGNKNSKNGWIFVKPDLTIVNSFAKPNDNHIYLWFNDTGLSLEEFKAIGSSNLTITDSGGTVLYSSILENTVQSGQTWKIELNRPISVDDILTNTHKVKLKYFGTDKEKTYISDIGIDMVKPLKAFNSIVLYDFGAESDDPSLVTLDVTIPSVIAGSDDVKLYFISKDSPAGSFWYPNPPLSSLPGNLSSFGSQSGTHEYSPLPDGGANQINFIIPSTDSYLVKDKVGQFMFVYKGWLPCARLKDPNNILSFDVWNFKIVGVQKQKGGVSVFNNVINPNKNQEATIGAHLKKSGMLTIQIMTLDGNVVRTLERSHKDAGDHFVNWDGRNNGGNPVASGMYFVRIAGPEIDEVRKILVVK